MDNNVQVNVWLVFKEKLKVSQPLCGNEISEYAEFYNVVRITFLLKTILNFSCKNSWSYTDNQIVIEFDPKLTLVVTVSHLKSTLSDYKKFHMISLIHVLM